MEARETLVSVLLWQQVHLRQWADAGSRVAPSHGEGTEMLLIQNTNQEMFMLIPK